MSRCDRRCCSFCFSANRFDRLGSIISSDLVGVVSLPVDIVFVSFTAVISSFAFVVDVPASVGATNGRMPGLLHVGLILMWLLLVPWVIPLVSDAFVVRD